MKCPILRTAAGDYRSRPVRALWIEISQNRSIIVLGQSRPVRALWIEMAEGETTKPKYYVEAREGLVD